MSSNTSYLAFHHTGVARELDAARSAIEADITEGWVRQAVQWLPRVPIRVLPRNVIITDVRSQKELRCTQSVKFPTPHGDACETAVPSSAANH